MFQKIKKIISPEEVLEIIKLTPEMKKVKLDRDETIKKIISGKDDRMLFIVGPCSADNEDSVLDYVSRLAKLAEEVKDKILSFQEYTQISRERAERGTKVCFIAPTRTKKSRTFKRESLL